MKIDPDRLRKLRQQKGLSRSLLAERSGISERTIQRLENEPQKTQKTQEHTLNSLAKTLGVETGVLTGDLPLPESDKVPADNPDRVQIGAQITPKVRLVYNLIKRRYGVSATEIINMAPLFFVLLAEKSLAWRRDKLQATHGAINYLRQIESKFEHGIVDGLIWTEDGLEAEAHSIDENDLFGKELYYFSGDMPFDPSTNNPFASYLRKLADDLAIPDVISVKPDDLSFGSPLKFPDYDVCPKELDSNEEIVRLCLIAGRVRLSDMPEELMEEDAQKAREKWLEDNLTDIYKKRGKWNVLAEIMPTMPSEIKELLMKEEGDDQ